MHKNVIRMVRVALLAAVLCAVSPFSVAIGPIPLSFASLGVYFAVGLLGLGEGTAAVSLYVLLGAVGGAGVCRLCRRVSAHCRLTGGYIVGYIACAVVAGLLWRRSSSPWRLALALLAGTARCTRWARCGMCCSPGWLWAAPCWCVWCRSCRGMRSRSPSAAA